ncbi:MAG: hypothetical protein VB017_04520 [Endomicrobiaceae bacterium]|nr:hypothetical protein [Endomicrobiaceae bacterium]
MKRIVLSVVSLFCFIQFVFAVSVTVYNDDLALVRDVKDVVLTKGEQKVEIDDVSSKIDPTSVLPKFLSDADKIEVYEQNFDFDLVNTNKLLQQYIGSNIEIEKQLPNSSKDKITAKLLAVIGGIVVQSNDKIILNPQGEISLPKLPEGVRLKPTLSWLINSKVSGKKQLEITYQTAGLSWISDYIVVLDKNDKNLDINAWVTINNLSGTSYKDANLKLIAGDVNKVQENIGARGLFMAKAASFDAANEASFQEKSFFEYHMYELGRKTTLKSDEKKQIEFASSQSVPFDKKYVYDGTGMSNFSFNKYSRSAKDFWQQTNKKVNVKIEFKNDKSSNLGIPLPKGKMRVYKNDGKNIEFIGEDFIDHTPENELISLNLGDAFDITGDRAQTEFETGDKYSQETISITVKNSKDSDADVEVIEPLCRWSNWKILSASDKYTKKDSQTVFFKVKVPAKGEKNITYTVKYKW